MNDPYIIAVIGSCITLALITLLVWAFKLRKSVCEKDFKKLILPTVEKIMDERQAAKNKSAKTVSEMALRARTDGLVGCQFEVG